jgi:hypothetical protein
MAELNQNKVNREMLLAAAYNTTPRLKEIDNLLAILKNTGKNYDIDKIKPYSVYIWTKDRIGDDGLIIYGDNVFDIMKDEIVFFDKNHVIPDEVMPIIRNIQSKLME